MTRKELDALRAEYLTLVPADFIRGAFISKENLRALLNKKRDCSGLFFYLIPDKSSNSAKFTMHVEPFDANKQRYEQEIVIDSAERGLIGESSLFVPCPPDKHCPQ
jgi:hypothetical protein